MRHFIKLELQLNKKKSNLMKFEDGDYNLDVNVS